MQFINRLFHRRAHNAFFTEWDKQRAAAAAFGPSHVAEIDAVFSRHLADDTATKK